MQREIVYESIEMCSEGSELLFRPNLVFIIVLLGKTSVDKPLLEYVSKKLNTR